MRRLRRESGWVGGQVRVLAWLGLLGAALALAGCATLAANQTYASGTGIPSERADVGDERPDALLALFSRSFGSGPMSSVPAGSSRRLASAEEEALIARAIAEHEMRKP
jgi:hypothetical protein